MAGKKIKYQNHLTPEERLMLTLAGYQVVKHTNAWDYVPGSHALCVHTTEDGKRGIIWVSPRFVGYERSWQAAMQHYKSLHDEE
jgi:hypothetical protein